MFYMYFNEKKIHFLDWKFFKLKERSQILKESKSKFQH